MKAALGKNMSRQQLSNKYTNLCKQHEPWPQEAVSFYWGRGRPTPVCTAEQAEMLLQLLPRRRAAMFRATGVQGAEKTRVEHLYVMRYSNDDSVANLGKSHNVEQGRRCVERGQNFFVHALCVFPEKGDLAKSVHARLKGRLSEKRAGKEWFKIPVSEGVAAVSGILQELERESANTPGLEPNDGEPGTA